MPTFREYLVRCLHGATQTGLTNPLVRMPVRRFRELTPDDLEQVERSGRLVVGTLADPITRNLERNYQTRIRERGEHCAYVAKGALRCRRDDNREELLPILLKKVELTKSGDRVTVVVDEDEEFRLNPLVRLKLHEMGIEVPADLSPDGGAAQWVQAQIGNRGRVEEVSYIGLFSSQQMLMQERFEETVVCTSLAGNAGVRARLSGQPVLTDGDDTEITDEGLEDLGTVLPTDDSQLRAIQLVDRGGYLHIEGPPGTGKSQTITNIVSNALWRKRRILFVCAKRTAIEQVAKRLREVGLGPAVLDLHDVDMNRKEFLEQCTTQFSVPRGGATPEHMVRRVQQLRARLNERVVHGRETAHSAVGVRRRTAIEGLLRLRPDAGQFPVVPVANLQALTAPRLNDLLSSIDQWIYLGDVVADRSDVWNAIAPEVVAEDPASAQRIADACAQLGELVKGLAALADEVAVLGYSQPMTGIADARLLLRLTRLAAAPPLHYERALGNAALSLTELTALKRDWHRCTVIATSRLPLPLTVPLESSYRQNVQDVVRHEKVRSWSDLMQRRSEYYQRIAGIEDLERRYAALAARIGLVRSDSKSVRLQQFSLIRKLASFDLPIPANWWQGDRRPMEQLSRWKARVISLAECAREAPRRANYVALADKSEADVAVLRRRAEVGFNVVRYALTYVEDSKCKYLLRDVYRKPSSEKVRWHALALHGSQAHERIQAVRDAVEHPLLGAATERLLAGLGEEDPLDGDTQRLLDRLGHLAHTVESMRTRDHLFDTGSSAWADYWISPGEQSVVEADALATMTETLIHLENVSAELAATIAGKERVEHVLNPAALFDADLHHELLKCLTLHDEYHQLAARQSALRPYLILAPEPGALPDWQRIEAVLQWCSDLGSIVADRNIDLASGRWPSVGTRLAECIEQWDVACACLSRYFPALAQRMDTFEQCVRACVELERQQPSIPKWVEKARWNRRIASLPEVEELWRRTIDGEVPLSKSREVFCYSLLHQLRPADCLHGAELGQVLGEFRQCDEELSTWSVARLQRELASQEAEAARRFAAQKADLERKAGQMRPRGTLRELVTKNCNYLLAAKPCWMMSPISVAALLNSDLLANAEPPFDLLVFDEASQLRAIEGLLPMAFASQFVIVGDRNQLPPTSFFSAFAGQEEDEPDDADIGDSLLEEFDSVATKVSLLSHYRSETPDLIRFSNEYFYKRLEIYPPAHVSGTGRRLHYLPTGVYRPSGTAAINPVEAEHVLKLVRQHVAKSASLSLGVVTLNQAQMEHIDELLQRETPTVREFCDDDRRFFLRNLETVQGDEMDRIILSITYGRTPDGRFNAAVLGPIVKSGGERRLNVAITRQRSGLDVVTSLRSADLAASTAASRGFDCLRQFLASLEAGVADRNFGIESKRFAKRTDHVSQLVFCESPFEEQVVEFLENNGYEIECQYGSGEFRIDIVVKSRGKCALAVECDGAAYHSSLVARTRDRARQRVLERRGWKVHRVWSTNWWHDPIGEQESLLAAVRAAVAS